MNTTAATDALAAMIAKTTGMLPGGHTGAGDPLRRCRRVLNGHLVQVEVIGHAGEVTEVTLPYETGTLPLAIADAAAKIAD